MRQRFLYLAILALGISTLPQLSASAQTAPADKGKRRVVALFHDALAAVNDSVVRVLADGKEVALGTVVSGDGYILTKGSELRGTLLCVLRDGTKHKAFQVGYHRPTDLALIKIEEENLKPVKFLGEDVSAIGNWVAVPGVTSEAVGVGVVSVKARKLYGDQNFVDYANKGVLGVLMKLESEKGVIIDNVSAESGASKAGIRKGDVIVEVAGKQVKDREGLVKILENYTPGDSVSVRVTRDEKDLDFKVKLGSRADTEQGDFQNTMSGALSNRRTGFPLVIQHDTVINPKDCGGPLVDLDGKVLGLNIARAGRVETWTLPGTVIRPILKELLEGKYEPISR